MSEIKFKEIYRNNDDYYVVTGDNYSGICIQTNKEIRLGTTVSGGYLDGFCVKTSIDCLTDDSKKIYDEIKYPIGTIVKGTRKNKYVNPENKFVIRGYTTDFKVNLYSILGSFKVKSSSIINLSEEELSKLITIPPFKIGDIIKKEDEQFLRFVSKISNGNSIDNESYIYATKISICNEHSHRINAYIYDYSGYKTILNMNKNFLPLLIQISDKFLSLESFSCAANKLPDSPMKKQLLNFIQIFKEV